MLDVSIVKIDGKIEA